MNEQFFQPYTFNNGTTVKNRLFMAPMTNGQSDADGRFSEEELNWLAMRAQGGFGAVITAGAAPTKTTSWALRNSRKFHIGKRAGRVVVCGWRRRDHATGGR